MDGTKATGASASEVPGLTAEEVRVLGCLIEKEATTPDSYPLTLNSLRNACNQSTSRDPVVSYGDVEVERALGGLRERGLTRTVHSTSNRATKYRHVVPEVLDLDPSETAVLAVLLLRGPQTVGELKARADRQHHFESTDEVGTVLDRLAERRLAVHLERQPGQKDARWMHLLGGIPDGSTSSPTVNADASPSRDTDPYGQATAEFYDLLASAGWELLGPRLGELLAGVDPAGGPIVDVGAGTGIGLPHLRAAVPNATVLAIEPSRAMRTALHARLCDDVGLRDATTVDPRTMADAALPERAAAVVATAVLGHLSDGERARLWSFVARCLPNGAPAVVGLLPPHDPIEIPRQRFSRRRVGEHVYEGWQAGRPSGDRHMSWTLSYRVLRGDVVVADTTVEGVWRCFRVDEVGEEVGHHGLVVRDVGDDLVVITR